MAGLEECLQAPSVSDDPSSPPDGAAQLGVGRFGQPRRPGAVRRSRRPRPQGRRPAHRRPLFDASSAALRRRAGEVLEGSEGGAPTEDETLGEGVRGESIRSVEPGGSALAGSVEAGHRRPTVKVRHDPPDREVGRRGDRDRSPARVVPGRFEASHETSKAGPRHGPEVEERGPSGRDGPGDDVARGELVDEALAPGVDESSPCSPQRLGEEDRRLDEDGRVELDELQVGEGGPRSMGKEEPLPDRAPRVGRTCPERGVTAGGEEDRRRLDRAPLGCEPLPRREADDPLADDRLDLWSGLDRFTQDADDGGARVGPTDVVDAPSPMATLEARLRIEGHAPSPKLGDPGGHFLDEDLDGAPSTEASAGRLGVGGVELGGIVRRRRRRDPALGEGTGRGRRSLGSEEEDPGPGLGRGKGGGQAGHPGPDDDEVGPEGRSSIAHPSALGEEHPEPAKGRPGRFEAFAGARFEGVEVDPVGQLGEEVGARTAGRLGPGGNVGPGFDLELGAQLAVDGVLDDDVDDPDAEVDEGGQLGLGLGGAMSDGDDGSGEVGRGSRDEQIAADGGDDRPASGSEDGNVVDDRLAAHSELPGEEVPGDRPRRGGEASEEGSPAVFGVGPAGGVGVRRRDGGPRRGGRGPRRWSGAGSSRLPRGAGIKRRPPSRPRQIGRAAGRRRSKGRWRGRCRRTGHAGAGHGLDRSRAVLSCQVSCQVLPRLATADVRDGRHSQVPVGGVGFKAMGRLSILGPPVVAIAFVAAACSGGAGTGSPEPGSPPPERSPTPTLSETARPSPDLGRLRVSTLGWKTDFTKTSVDLGEFLGGGPPKDGIPAIDAPVYETIADARAWLEDRSPVIALEVGGEARAYPLAILMWHEIVNDDLGGIPVVVTFCPLCNTALVFERELEGVVYDFGTTGNLRFSDLVMYDRQTESWWQQATGEAIVGELTGKRLTFLPAQIVSLGDFAATHPAANVLSRETGYRRAYGRNPYVGYDTIDQNPFLFDGVVDGRLPPKERVVTIGEGETAVALPYSELRKVGVAAITVGDEPVVVFWRPGTASALEGPSINENADVGATGVFKPVVDGRSLTFERVGGEDGPIKDRETGSTWSVTGVATAGPLAGSRLEPVVHGDHFWFAWAAFAPATTIWTAP